MSVKVPPRGNRGAFFPRALASFANRMIVRQCRQRGGREPPRLAQ